MFLLQKVKIRDVDSEKLDDKTPDVLSKIPDISKLLTVRRIGIINSACNIQGIIYVQIKLYFVEFIGNYIWSLLSEIQTISGYPEQLGERVVCLCVRLSPV